MTEYEALIEVRRDESGYLEIPGAAEQEDPITVYAEMAIVENYGPLVGWDPWVRLYECRDEYGLTRWYMARD